VIARKVNALVTAEYDPTIIAIDPVRVDQAAEVLIGCREPAPSWMTSLVYVARASKRRWLIVIMIVRASVGCGVGRRPSSCDYLDLVFGKPAPREQRIARARRIIRIIDDRQALFGPTARHVK
jgi:hypothetical protein